MKIQLGLFRLYTYDGAGFIEIAGYGFAYKDLRKHKLNFSERNNYKKTVTIGNYNYCFINRRASK